MVQKAQNFCGTVLFETYSVQQPDEFIFFLNSPSMTLLLHFDFEIVWKFTSKDFRYFYWGGGGQGRKGDVYGNLL